MLPKELDCVLTRSGREGTIVSVYGDHEAYEIEYYEDGEWILETITLEDIVEIVYVNPGGGWCG
ncbi:hypothetical protein M3G15_09575 [Paenibacillus sp. p3-SID1389]|uniref:hypothetical protein n=1 Tax=Paenibacillus sp. p3-SID1389 TaxID=2916364 RepID=UPI0021A8128B|nr:hypothetical protein [Paenibacillus sp. p3-SID1389]MCT2195389.1 hypothetical protein [Paenibacillus sp. p3-SID1389]